MSVVTATTLDDVLTALAAGARPLAGGTDMVVGARQGKSPLPEQLVLLDRVPELHGIEISDRGLRIGAAVSHDEIVGDARLAQHYSALPDASALVGSHATRHVGTIGGNLMNGSPAMDTGAPFVVLGAEAELRSARGVRRVAVTDLWAGPGRTTAADDELCVAVHVPTPPAAHGSAYLRLEYRRAMEIAVVGAAASVRLAEDGSVLAVAVALSAVAPTILPLQGLGALAGASIDDVAEAVGTAAAGQARPISDTRASDEYRRRMVGVIARRAALVAARRARGEQVAIPANRSTAQGAHA